MTVADVIDFIRREVVASASVKYSAAPNRHLTVWVEQLMESR